ncbi:nucleotide disphospho-sugar-binding domain-containing protein [Millisia brevis]|uniref:nucleotide disphospho-sugar-binding domain-containing protein n=1 Tax=Millisia brevis TaxID=264148 RepID=UPI000830B77D|nr:nucleotide disphospho-sugar-binding domain-containing protein [Millisia brevis]
MTTERTLTVVFLPESAYGPTNNCVGIGDILLRRGHRVVMAAESSWRGKLAPLGFEEALVDLAPPAPEDDDADAGQFWKDYIRETAPVFRTPTIEQIDSFIKPTFQALIDGAVYCEPALRRSLADIEPDVIVEDNVVTFPALQTAGVPYVRVVSCNPLEVRGPAIAPPFSGYAQDDTGEWAAYQAEYDRVLRPMWTEFDAWAREQGVAPLPDLDFVHTSPDLNLYVYPEELDYPPARELDATWHRLDSSVRRTDPAADLPAWLTDRPDDAALIYLSLGSLGSADVDLMRRLIAVLAPTPHRYVVSMGPCHAELTLADNMWGAEFVPQTSILPLVDLVITHGGNNTTTEAVHFGKPMVVLPLFWDQYDNAQRVHERGFGVRLSTYGFTDEELTGTVDRLLADTALRDRVAAAGVRVRAADGLTRAADLIEQIAAHPPDRP